MNYGVRAAVLADQYSASKSGKQRAWCKREFRRNLRANIRHSKEQKDG
jgi:hypothetical protein